MLHIIQEDSYIFMTNTKWTLQEHIEVQFYITHLMFYAEITLNIFKEEFWRSLWPPSCLESLKLVGKLVRMTA